MPGKNGTAIEIPVNLRAQVANLKQLKETLVKASDEAGKESTLGKQLQKQLQNVNSMLSDLDELMISPTIDEAGFKQAQSLFDKFFKETNKAFTNIDIASFEQIATPEQLARVKEYHEEIKKLAQERERLEKHGSAERSDTYLTREGKTDVLTRGKAQKGFDPTASLGKNAENLEKLANQQMQSIASLTEANTQLANEAVAAAAAFKTATQTVTSLKTQRDTLRKDELAATFYHQMGSFDTSVPANANLRRPNIDNIRTGLRKSFNAVATDGGEIITEARDTVASWLQTTFNNVSATEATQMVNQNITTLLEQVMEKIFGDNYRNLDVSYNTDHSALLGNMQQDVRSRAEQLNRAHGTTNAMELTTQRQLMDTQLKQAQEVVAKAKTATDKANTKLTENQDALARLETTEANTRLLATELKELAATAREAALAANETAAALKKEEQAEYKENVVSSVKQTGAAGRVLNRSAGDSAGEALDEAGGLLAAGRSSADEAKEFKEHMQQSVKHWMGAQQIISLVKNGIRQAYQDIKNLDTAMTNIAVVTDMSISDLWGKINEYMSIAQQYGVTTQGVYEVSQLYYQQGLSTNEVMAATTETLKLARIAGMGYAEAADAMTVAIRSFKMEMSDAQQVTDVYSKVAAITASDSEELAIAMSKTASSAESVGSSFENTTAMLAVMVETTRESAQNLGSALKSIISRYGEMKVGLTVDSEGEEIDYNKVDTALKSVGISIKDAQGQFRDFDDVIFELSEKWDSLDKNTQRYIATIMAGNRQQSRFIALVDNWERLEEVSAAAADSADAGLLQYAKTLDSLDTKLNQLSNNFQAFYMSIFNGEFFKGLVDIANNIVTSFSRMGPILGGLNLLKLINQIKLVGQLLINSFASAINKIRGANKDWQNSFTGGWEGVGAKIAKKIADALIKAGPKTGQAYVESIQEGIHKQQQPEVISDDTEIIARNDATLSSLHNLTGLVGVQESIANSTKGYHSKANYAFGHSGAHKNNSYLTYASQVLADPNASQIDRDWANKINQAYSEYIQAIKATEVTIEQQQEAGQKALQAIKQADAERKEEVQILAQKNEELKQQQAYIEAETRAARRNKIKQNIGRTAFTVGTLAQTAALGMDTSTMEGYDTQGWVKGLGGAATAAGQFLTGDILGGAVTAVTTVIDIWNHVANRAQVELENAKKAAEEANVERAQSKEEYKSLENYTKRLEELNETRFESNEAQEEWLALNNEMAEKYPELISYIDSEGNSIVNLTAGYEKLSQAKVQALKDNADYWAKELDYQKKQIDQIGNTTFNSTVLDSNAATINTNNLATGIENGIATSYNNANGILYWTDGGFLFQPTNDSGGWIGDAYSMPTSKDEEWAASQFGNEALSYKVSEDIPDFYKNFFVKPEEYTTGSEAYAKILEIFQAQSEGNTIYSLIDSGIDMAGMVRVLNSEEGSALADSFIRTGLVERDSTSGEITLTETGKYVAQLQKDRNLYERTVENFISSTGNLILQTSTVLESISDISGWEELALIDATSSASSYGKDWRQMNEIDIRTAYEEFANTTKTWYSTLSQKQQDEFNNVLTNLNNYTEAELKRILTEDFGLQDTDPIYKAIELKYAEQRRTAVERYAANFGRGEFQSFEEYKAKNASADKTDEELAQGYINAITGENTDIANLTTKELEAYVNRRLELDALIKDEQNALWSTFNNQKQLVETAKGYLNDPTLEEGARTELEALISAEDFGSVDWSKRITEWEQKWGKTLDETDPIISESFFTYVDGALDKVEGTLDSFEDIAEKQSKGFTFDEARDLLQRYQKLDGHANASFDDIFEVLEDGTIVLKDLNQVTSDFYAQQAKDMEEASSRAGNAINSIYSTIGETASAYDVEVFKKDSDTDWLNDVLSNAGVDPTMIPTIMAGIADGTIKTWNDVIAFLTRTKEEVDAGAEYFNKQTQVAVNESAWNKWYENKITAEKSPLATTESLDNYKDVLIQRATKRAMDSRDPNDQGPIDITDALDREYALMEVYGATIDEAGNIIWESQAKRVNYLLHTSQITVEEAEDLLEYATLTDSSNKAERTETFTNAAKEFVDALREGKDDLAVATKAFIDAILPEDASDEVRDAVTESVMELGPNATDEQISAAIMEAGKAAGIEVSQAEIDAYLADSTTARTKHFFELYEKWIEGTITETELIEFEELGKILGYNLPDLTKEVGESARETVEAYGTMLKEALVTGNQAAIDSARKGFQNATVDYLKQLALDQEFGAGGKGLDLYSTIGNINKASGVYTAEIFGAIAGQTDGSFDFEEFNKYYTWDSEAQGFIQTGAGTTKEALIAIYGEDVPEAIINAYDASEFDKEVQKAIEHDNNLTSIPEKFASLISDPLNASLDELIKFWESLLGRELTADEYQKVYDARQDALDGNTETLEEMFAGWSSLAINQGYDVRWDTIKQATWGKQAQQETNIEKWLKGNGTIDDLGDFWVKQYDAGGVEGSLEDFLNSKIGSMRGAFIDTAGNLIVTDYEEFMDYLASEGLVDEATLTQYAAEIQDTTLKTIKSIFDYITKAIEGTLTATELRDMGQAVVNSGTMSADEWHTFASQNISRVGTGYKMNEAAAFALQVNTGNYDFEDLVNQFDNLDEVNEMLIELQENSAEWGDEFVRAAERVLQSIQLIKAQDPKDAMFNWMDQDMEGWAGTYESTIGSIGKANDIINASMESGTMGLNDFYNMSHIVASQLEGDQLDAWNQYRDAVYATATTVDGGTVSLTNSQMTMEKALGIMGKSTEAYYQDIAKQQIDFIDKQIAALEAQKKVDEALKSGSGSSNAALNREDLVYTGIAGDIGLYSEEEYAAAEQKWFKRGGPQYVGGEEQNTSEAFAATVSKYIGEATQDALKAGLDITDAQVQQQIKDSAMARAGIDGYYDTLQNEELNALTDIKTSVANIEQAVVQKALIEPNTGDTGVVDNGTGSGNDTANLTDPRVKERELSIEEKTLGQSEQQTEHQAHIEENTDATTKALEGTNSLLTKIEANTRKKANTPSPVEQYIDSLDISDAQKQFYKDWYHDRDNEDGTNDYDIGLQNGIYSKETIIAEMDNAAKTISMRNQLSGEENLSWLPKYSSEEMQDWFLHGLPQDIWMYHEDPGYGLSKYTSYDAISGKNDNDHFLWSDSFNYLEKYGSAYFPEDHWARKLNIGPKAGETYLDDWIQQGQNLLNNPLLSNKLPAWYQETSANNPEMAAYQYAYDNNLLSAEDRRLYEELIALIETVREKEFTSGAAEEGQNGGIGIAETAESRIPHLNKWAQAEKREEVIEDLLKTIEDFKQIYEQYVVPGMQEAGSRIVGEDPTIPESQLEEKTVVDAVVAALEEHSTDEGTDYAAIITSVSEAVGKPLQEWLPILQNAIGNGQAYGYAHDWQIDGIKEYHLGAFEQEATLELAKSMAQQIAETVQVTLDENPAEIPINSRTATAESEIAALRQRINKTRASVLVDLNIQPTTVQVTTDGSVDTVSFASATGNVNGLAFATGTEKLIAGAHLANKSLVGELGPELAVYDGQYHLLGANGAEFANIPSDAIIFNHKQTEGILKGQANIRGRVKDGGEAFAEGNVSGPAYGPGNIDAAIKALQEARAMWQSLLDRGLGDLAGIGSNKGGGGNMAKAYSAELQEWYNLLRQIADIEAEINQLIAERTNLQNEYNGEAVARNLRQQQMLLNQQLKTQETLLRYQDAQLKRQAEQINNDRILSQFIEVNEDGIVQYLKGNEAFGGKGTLEVLSWLNDASAKEQLKFIKDLDFQSEKAARDQDGNLLEGEDLVQAFFDYFDTAINEYDGLQDTVNESTTKLEDIKASVTDINNEIRDNQMELEQNIFDTIVDAWEANIDALEEQKELIEEANEAYVEGLNEALQVEREMYDEQNAIADREQLQRQLSLLRRSGGSASEIADLEAQLDDALKDEYFRTQEDMIKGIEDANKTQIELLEKQITIQEDALEFQKENGVIWQKVAEILSGTKESIMEFFRGNSEGFFSKSKEQQIDALNEWSYSVGMYKEDQLMKSQAMDFANGIVGEDSKGKGGVNVWGTEQLKGYKSLYDELDDNQKQVVHDAYGTAYQQAISEGQNQDEARAAGYEAAAKQLKNYQAERDAIKNIEDNNNNDNNSAPPSSDSVNQTKYVTINIKAADGHGNPTVNGKQSLTIEPNKVYTITPNPDPGYEFDRRKVGNSEKTQKTFSVTGEYSSVSIQVWYKPINTGSGEETGMLPKLYGAKVYDANNIEYHSTGKAYKTQEEANAAAAKWIKSLGAAAGATKWSIKPYKTGGLVDYTGPALVHGTKSKPEAFLNAEQTALISEAVQSFSATGSLTQMRETLASMASSIKGVVSSVATTANNNSITIAPNAIAIHVDELADSYDVESLSNDIMNRITSIASKAGSRGINRR